MKNHFSKWSSSGKNEDRWWRSSHGKSSTDKSSRIFSSIWRGSENFVEVEVDIENDSSWSTFIGSVSIEKESKNDYTTWYVISKGIKGIALPNESTLESEGTIQGSSNAIVFNEIIWIVVIEDNTLGGGKEKVPSKSESLIKPAPTSL